jgi:hypothetical protein
MVVCILCCHDRFVDVDVDIAAVNGVNGVNGVNDGDDLISLTLSLLSLLSFSFEAAAHSCEIKAFLLFLFPLFEMVEAS